MNKRFLLLLMGALLAGAAACSAPWGKGPSFSPADATAEARQPSAPITTLSPTPTPYMYLNEAGETVSARFIPPSGYTREEADGYGEYVRSQRLMPYGSPVLLFNGELGAVQNWHAAVLAIDVGDRDLQQCADAALRLRCEYLYSIGDYEAIDYHLTNGDTFPYSKWREGYRLNVEGNETSLEKTAQPDESYESFRSYLDMLFRYASTRSLFPESEKIDIEDLRIGDLFIFAGRPGHCVIVMDMCVNPLGQKAILLGQSSMPAQQIHILQSPDAEHPWLFLKDLTFPVRISGWLFEKEHVRRMP